LSLIDCERRMCVACLGRMSLDCFSGDSERCLDCVAAPDTCAAEAQIEFRIRAWAWFLPRPEEGCS